LPHEVVWQRKKRGFDVPQEKWIRALNPYLKTLLKESTSNNAALNMDRLIHNIDYQSNQAHVWRLISLQLWLLKNGLKI
jgi:asparagine synthetase B (glutamine-hydrolysing)